MSSQEVSHLQASDGSKIIGAYSDTTNAKNIASGSANQTNYENTTNHHHHHYLSRLPGCLSEGEDKTYYECMKALPLTNPRHDLIDIQRDREDIIDGTYEWISKQDEYHAWYHGENPQALVFVGAPGIGKTMLSVCLADRFRSDLKGTNQTLAYFFCDNKVAKRRTATAILRGLLTQLLEEPRFFKHMRIIYSRMEKSLFDNFGALWGVLLDILEDHDAGPIYLLIDALDECEKSSVQDIVKVFASLKEKKVKTKFLITCRPNHEIETEFPKRLIIDPVKVKDLVSIYTRVKVEKLASDMYYSGPLKAEVHKALEEKSEGTFLWVSLVIGDLYKIGAKKSKRERVRKTLKTLPRTLNEMYDRILSQIEQDYADEARFVLQWVAVARRPLTVDELNMAYNLWSGEWKEDEVPERVLSGNIYEHCKPLVYVDEKNHTVNLVHQSAKDYLLSHDNRLSIATFLVFALPTILWARLSGQRITLLAFSAVALFGTLPFEAFSSPSRFTSAIRNIIPNTIISRYRVVPDEANRLLFKICWKYLEIMGPEKDSTIVQTNDKKVLMPYAAEEWLGHALAASPASITEVAWTSDISDKLSILRNRWLLAAAGDGHRAVVQLLLEIGADVTTKNDYGLTALHLAARNGHSSVVRLLLEKRANFFRQELGGSIEDMSESVIEALFLKEIGPNNPDILRREDWLRRLERFREEQREQGLQWMARWFLFYLCPIFYAWRRMPKWALLRLFCEWLFHWHFEEPGWDEWFFFGLILFGALLWLFMYESRFWWWSRFWGFWWWSRYRRGEVFESLHSLRLWFSQTLLSIAAQNGYNTVAKFLLEKAVKPDFWGSFGWTPLSLATDGGHDPIVRLLLEKGAKPDFWNGFGRTPLSLAAESGHDTIARLLLEKGAKPDFRDSSGRTPLSLAAGSGHDTIARLLLESGKVDPDRKDSRYELTPLSWAASRGHESLVQLFLLCEGVDVNSRDRDGDTPLSNAAAKGHIRIVNLLIMTKGVDLNAKTNENRTPLLLAVQNGHEAVVNSLLNTGKADSHSKDSSGRAPMSYAIEGRHTAIINLLREIGKVDPDLKSESGLPLEMSNPSPSPVVESRQRDDTDLDRVEEDLVRMKSPFCPLAGGYTVYGVAKGFYPLSDTANTK